MKYSGFLLLFLCFLCTTLKLQSQSADGLWLQAEKLEKEMKEIQAYGIYQQILQQQPNHLKALVKCSELASRIGKLQSENKKQVQYYSAALVYAKKALQINAYDSDVNLVLAIAYGRFALMRSGSEKVEMVREIKAYAERSLKYNPDNFKAMHVLGKWHYEVSNLNMIEQAAVRFFFGGLPDASLDSSIYFYQKAKTLAPGFSLNYLELAKALHRNGQKKQALYYLNQLFTLPFIVAEDAYIRKEATKLRRDWQN